MDCYDTTNLQVATIFLRCKSSKLYKIVKKESSAQRCIAHTQKYSRIKSFIGTKNLFMRLASSWHIKQKWSTTNPETVFFSFSHSLMLHKILCLNWWWKIDFSGGEAKVSLLYCHKNTGDYVAQKFVSFRFATRRWNGIVQVHATDAFVSQINSLSYVTCLRESFFNPWADGRCENKWRWYRKSWKEQKSIAGQNVEHKRQLFTVLFRSFYRFST